MASRESFLGVSALGVPQARAVAGRYIEQFFRYQLFDDMDSRAELMVPMNPNAQTSDFAATIQNVNWSASLSKFHDGDTEEGLAGLERPLIYGEHTPGVLLPGAGRLLVDSLTRTGGAQCGSEAGTTILDGSISTLGGSVSVNAPGSATACQGAADVLMSTPAYDYHLTEAARVQWGGGAGEVTIEWSLRGENGLMLPGVSGLHDYTHVELRVANAIDHDSGDCLQPTDEMGAFEVEVELVTESPSGQEVEHAVGAGLSIEPHIDPVPIVGSTCYGLQFLRTARIPLVDFCDQGEMSIGNFKAIRVRFPEDTTAHTALIDSIAFSRDPSAAQTPKCPKATGSWRCAARSTLEAVETSCSDITGLCQTSPPTHQEEVDLPFVDDGGSGFSGWIAHSPKGWVKSLDNPTQAETDAITASLCVKACQEEFAAFPEIEINCEDSGVFDPPTLLAANSIAPVQRVPADRLDASGVFENQSLACSSIHDDCCEAFLSDVCPAKVLRPSPAEALLGRAEDFVLELSGSATKLVIETPSDTFTMPLVGTAGLSIGPPSSGSGGALVAPFYLGSLVLESVQSVQIEDECPDQSELELLVSSFEVELMQPSIGIAVLDQTFDAGFPAGALHARLHATVDGVPMTLRVVNPEDVVMSVSPAFALDELDVELELPCGDDVLPVTATLMFEHTDELEQPPQGGITSSPLVSCPNWLTLSHNISDVDGDLDTIRWYVDDVLMAPSVVRIWVDDTHELKLVAKDERGATIERTLTVGCI
jgi:hypothetical protein